MKNRIRDDLWNGMTINNACRKYRVSFQDIVEMMKNDVPPTEKRTCDALYVSPYYNKFRLSKNSVHYGTYNTVEDAVKVRDWFILHRWDKRKVDEVCRIVGVKRCKQGRYAE